MSTSSFLSSPSANNGFIEDVYLRYQENPLSVSPEWRSFFEGFSEGFGMASRLAANSESLAQAVTLSQSAITEQSLSPTPRPIDAVSSQAGEDAQLLFDFKVASLVRAFESQAHLGANTNPLVNKSSDIKEQILKSCHFTEADFLKETAASAQFGNSNKQNLKSFIASLESIFLKHVGIEIDHVQSEAEKSFLRAQFSSFLTPVSDPISSTILKELSRADALEKTISTKFIGKKRFSIEGADSQLVALESLAQKASELGAKELCLGMAHRGRLNILVNFVGKPCESLFAEFDGYPNPDLGGDGDVKYHGGYEADRTTRNGTPLRIAMSSNPSHLEFVDPVTMGEARAKQEMFYNGDTQSVLAVLLHGDAAFAGQGVVYESIQMMTLPAYSVGGVIHIVANNQVGFTTNPADARSAVYCSDVAKVVGAPVFHVNGNDPESVHRVLEIAVSYRYKFKKDVIIDIICYRRHGHNETDEPTFSQPELYKSIKDQLAPYEVYAKDLISKGKEFGNNYKDIYDKEKQVFEKIFDETRKSKPKITLLKKSRGISESLIKGTIENVFAASNTSVSEATLKSVGRALVAIPEGFTINPKLQRTIVGERLDMIEGNKPVDWGMGELLAYASLLNEGISVRLVGQDVRRGTFNHRHVAFVDFNNNSRVIPIAQCAQLGSKISVYDSFLSETAALGYEYGFSIQHENCLTIWEAQFGDFVNGAQVILDQFVTTSETKWGLSTGLVLLLPHGYDGMGPEHSSARLERFLQSAAQGNIQVAIPTSSSQLFHLLRRQVKRNFRKPLVVLTPKSYLRNHRVTCSWQEFSNGKFEEILNDPRFDKETKNIKRIVLCTGKIGVELLDYAEKQGNSNKTETATPVVTLEKETAIVRLEQIYPLHAPKLQEILRSYAQAESIFWVQEEPKNMGAYSHLQSTLQNAIKIAKPKLKGEVGYIGRSARASTSVGIEKLHNEEQESLWKAAFYATANVEI